MPMKEQNEFGKFWADIIDSVKTPLGLFALTALVVSGALVALSYRASGGNQTILILAICVVLLAIPAFGFYYLRTKESAAEKQWLREKEKHEIARAKDQQTIAELRRKLEQEPEYEYDVFLSAPMAAYDDSDGQDSDEERARKKEAANQRYIESRAEIEKIFRALRDTCKYRVFWAAENIRTMKDFETADTSANVDLEGIRKSEYFVLIYPEKMVTSALFEAGYALALDKLSLYFVPDDEMLPFLMRDVRNVNPRVRIHERRDWQKIEDIAALFERQGRSLFAQKASPTP